MSARLKVGDRAPAFAVLDVFGAPIEPVHQGLHTLLSFYRYASCPLCNLRVRELIQQYPTLSQAGIRLVAVFQSPEASIREYVGRQDAPFPIMADPDLELYRRYGVEARWGGALKAGLTRLAELPKALRGGFLPGRLEGPVHRIPADFLISPTGKIEIAYYGKDIGDHLPLESVYAQRLHHQRRAEPAHAGES